MGEIRNTLVEILKELKIIRAQLEVITGKKFIAGRRFDL